jgi:hypothetical protein
MTQNEELSNLLQQNMTMETNASVGKLLNTETQDIKEHKSAHT